MSFNPQNNKSVYNGDRANTTPSNPINDPSYSNKQGSNTFDLSAQNAFTARFGEITPYFYTVGVPRDRITLTPRHNLQTYTLGSRLMSPIRMHMQNFSVPISCMMPNTWEYIYKNPVKGEDIPDDALCSIGLGAIAAALKNYIGGSTTINDSATSITTLDDTCRLLPYYAFSKGGLLDYLGIHVDPFGGKSLGRDKPTLDEYFDSAVTAFLTSTAATNTGYSYWISYKTSSNENKYVNDLSTLREFFDELVNMEVTQASCINQFVAKEYHNMMRTLSNTFYLEGLPNDSLHEINLYKVIAYQMICAQYFTNDHVDDIYSSDLWLSNQKALLYNILESQGASVSDYSFSLNGVEVFYDVFSKHMLSLVCAELQDKGEASESAIAFFSNLLLFRKSLRYGDYFMSSRTQPLAVGDVTAPVTSSGVSAIDTTKSIVYQRFLNAVNRAGSYIQDYVKSIFGVTPTQTAPMPNFLSRETFTVGKDEIDNTGENQGNIVTNLVSQDSKFAFDIFIDTPSIILGLLTFDAVGCYEHTIEKDNFHLDRYDMFNPMLQNIGDQRVEGAELFGYNGSSVISTFGYQVRNAEYKFKYNQSHGGFNYNLPSWLFKNDFPNQSLNSLLIRYKPSDLDDFYTSLTYGSPAGYYHFIISVDNGVKANRAMQYEPPIL